MADNTNKFITFFFERLFVRDVAHQKHVARATPAPIAQAYRGNTQIEVNLAAIWIFEDEVTSGSRNFGILHELFDRDRLVILVEGLKNLMQPLVNKCVVDVKNIERSTI